MGAWIEIWLLTRYLGSSSRSHPTMGAWIEIEYSRADLFENESHPTMGAWIEIE